VDPEDLRQHGNDFLREFYPRLDYIQSCSLDFLGIFVGFGVGFDDETEQVFV
jgi:hypothetical protein